VEGCRGHSVSYEFGVDWPLWTIKKGEDDGVTVTRYKKTKLEVFARVAGNRKEKNNRNGGGKNRDLGVLCTEGTIRFRTPPLPCHRKRNTTGN